MLVQQRSKEKITFPGVLANACCSHPLDIDNENYSIFQENEFLIVSNKKQNLIKLKSVSNESLNDF